MTEWNKIHCVRIKKYPYYNYYFAACNNAAADVVVLMDDSGSVGRFNFDNSMKPAVKKMITKFNIGSSATDG